MPKGIANVPQVMQMEALECGAACLTMILAYYGRWVPLEQVRADCGVSRDGSKASNVLKAARSYGLAAKGMTYSTKALREKVTFPCILFWNFNHFVVLTGFKGKYAYINDPARGQIKVPMAEFEDSFTGVTLVFEKTDAFEEGGSKPNTLKYARDRLEGLGMPIAFVMLTAAITSLVAVVSTSMSSVFADRILTQENPDWLVPVIGLMLALAIVSGVISILNAMYLMRIQGKIAVVSSSRFMRHLLHLPVGFYAQRMVGDLQQRQSANETIAFQLIGQLAPVIVNGVMLVFYLIIMLQYSVLLTLIGLLTVAINTILGRYISKKRVNISRSAAASNGKLYATTVSGVEMIETIKAAGAENGYFSRWAGYQAAVNEAAVRTTKLNQYLGAVPAFMGTLTNIIVLVLGIYLIVNQLFTPGMLLAFQGFLGAFMAPVNQLIELGQTVQEMRTQMERVEDVMRYEADVPEELEAEEETEAVSEFGREKLGGRVDIEGLTFGYSPLEPPLIENFDLHLEPGQWVALVGGSGCGKSTVTKLVSGLYEPWAGEIKFDGTPLKEVPHAVLRGSFAVVDQDIVTFDDTVSDNVKLWDHSIEDYEVIMACRDADIHDVISQREGGYSSRILPGGRNFSGGQLQRLEIARVLAQDPTIIVLDEATSALDAQTEASVIKRIRDRDITCIVVAHRLSTIRDCDEIIVLDDGKVVERGTHDELLALNGTYAELVRND
ncbi:MAG: NHLP family bacteriocin export ABC transporter peptidase/permease/ATPase subunit [Coriobacteriaceae bacterium]|nr:NHLP family bacteriocin export ABC transporter peptidase/permease/ATPase subunit [Coriobacteriaceae bacterium]